MFLVFLLLLIQNYKYDALLFGKLQLALDELITTVLIWFMVWCRSGMSYLSTTICDRMTDISYTEAIVDWESEPDSDIGDTE